MAESWESQQIPTELVGQVFNLSAVSCASTLDCLAVGSAITATGDGGKRWKVENQPDGVAALNSITCPSVSHCVAVLVLLHRFDRHDGTGGP